MPPPGELKPNAVPGPDRTRTKPDGAVRDRWPWTKPWVWTKRMLTALEKGVKDRTWFSLIDKVFDETTLYAAACRVTAAPRKAAGVDHVTPAHFARKMPEEVARLAHQLRRGTYQPQAVRRTWIAKPGSSEKRPLGIPTVRDRVVQTALRDAIEPIFQRDFAEHSYGFRPGRGGKDALRRVDALLKAGYTTVVDVDLKSYFDTIDHEQLLARLRTKISDGRVLALIEQFLKQGVMDGLRQWTPEEGTPQGAVISPLLGNVYLDPLDHLLSYLEDCFLVRFTWLATDSERRRMVNPRKVYPIDSGLIPIFDRSGKSNIGHALETAVRIELERRDAQVYYVRTQAGYEVDFLARLPEGDEALIQVCADLGEPETRERQIRALEAAAAEFPRASLHLITLTPESARDIPENVQVHNAPVWFLEPWLEKPYPDQGTNKQQKTRKKGRR